MAERGREVNDATPAGRPQERPVTIAWRWVQRARHVVMVPRRTWTENGVGEGQTGEEQAAGASPRSIWRYLPLAVLVVGTIAVFATGAHRYLSLGKLIEYRDWLQESVETNRLRSILVLAIVYVTAVALSVPGAVFLTILSGFLFGWLVGGTLAVLSASLGAVIFFLIARTSLGDVLVRLAGPRLKGLADGFRQDAFSYLLFLRFLPIVPFWLTNLACALFGVPLRTFAIATLVGIVPATFTFATAGAGLDSVIDAQREAQRSCLAAGGTECGLDLSLSTLLTPQIIIAFAALGVLSLIPVFLRWRAGSRSKLLSGKPGPA